MFIFTFMMRKNRVAISIFSRQSAHYQTFLDAYVEEGGRKGREATVSSDSLFGRRWAVEMDSRGWRRERLCDRPQVEATVASLVHARFSRG